MMVRCASPDNKYIHTYIDIKSISKSLYENYRDELNGIVEVAFLSEIYRWKRCCETKFVLNAAVDHQNVQPKKADRRRKNPQHDSMRVDGKQAFVISDPPDGFIETLTFADEDFFPSVRQLLLIGATSPIGSTEAERAASGIRRLKSPYRSKMSDIREGNLNLIQLQRIVPQIDVEKVVDIFRNARSRRMFDHSLIFDETP